MDDLETVVLGEPIEPVVNGVGSILGRLHLVSARTCPVQGPANIGRDLSGDSEFNWLAFLVEDFELKHNQSEICNRCCHTYPSVVGPIVEVLSRSGGGVRHNLNCRPSNGWSTFYLQERQCKYCSRRSITSLGTPCNLIRGCVCSADSSCHLPHACISVKAVYFVELLLSPRGDSVRLAM